MGTNASPLAAVLLHCYLSEDSEKAHGHVQTAGARYDRQKLTVSIPDMIFAKYSSSDCFFRNVMVRLARSALNITTPEIQWVAPNFLH